jgi:hypothetical protein
MGAKVMYCGHAGWFLADIFRVGNACVVRANGPIDGGKLVRGRDNEATHHVMDFPAGGFWRPELGVLVVPEKQVQELENGQVKKKPAAKKSKKSRAA